MGMGEDLRQGDKEGLVTHSSLGRPGSMGAVMKEGRGQIREISEINRFA